MKKRITLSFIAFVVTLGSSLAFADNYGTAGCGLGALAFKDQPGKIQILAATVNNLISPQTFAITSGTSNCFQEGNSTSSMFISVNKVALQKDISRGSGESISSLSQILKCSDTARLGRSLQRNFKTIFPSETTPADQIDKSIHSTIRGDEVLAKDCRSVS